jgi:hypothetical protein
MFDGTPFRVVRVTARLNLRQRLGRSMAGCLALVTLVFGGGSASRHAALSAGLRALRILRSLVGLLGGIL